MDATNNRIRDKSKKRRRRHGRQHPPRTPSPPAPPQRSDSIPWRDTESVENKMGLPPPYEQAMPNPAPPPSYFGNNPPPPPGMVPPAAAPRTTVITSPPTGTGGGTGTSGVGPGKLGPGRTGTTCESCNKQIVTRVQYVPNNRTHIISAALCVVAGCCCGCFIPYCMRSCKTANHYCPACKAFIGSYTPS